MPLLVARARAYVYAGDWVADCPRNCGNVEYLFEGRDHGPRKVQFFCSYCKLIAPIEWANDEEQIMEVLGKRPIPHNRNWYPQGHEGAIKLRLEHGQSVGDLREENLAHGVEA